MNPHYLCSGSSPDTVCHDRGDYQEGAVPDLQVVQLEQNQLSRAGPEVGHPWGQVLRESYHEHVSIDECVQCLVYGGYIHVLERPQCTCQYK